jgi:hypothetical protein
MDRMIAITICFICISEPASAQFRAKKTPPLGKWNSLECAIIQATDKDRDPVYKIEVNLGFDDDGKLDTLFVAHVTAGGARYVRSEQYKNASLWQTPGKTEYYWKGNRDKFTMEGYLVRTVEGKWFYAEKLFRNGRQEYQMNSACHVEPGEGE